MEPVSLSKENAFISQWDVKARGGWHLNAFWQVCIADALCLVGLGILLPVRDGQQLHKWIKTCQWVSVGSFVLRAGKSRARFHPGRSYRLAVSGHPPLSVMLATRVCAYEQPAALVRSPSMSFSHGELLLALHILRVLSSCLEDRMIVHRQWDIEYLHCKRILGRHKPTREDPQMDMLA